MPRAHDVTVTPVEQKMPERLRPYAFHGVSFNSTRGKEATAQCPFCSREDKFSVNVNTGEARCLVCQTGSDKGGMNATIFIRKLHELCCDATRKYAELQQDRKLLYPETLISWEVCQSPITGEWLVPGYGANRQLMQLYRYVQPSKSQKRKLLPTPTLGHGIHGGNLYDDSRPIVYLCEGPWDGMALWEVLRRTKHTEQGLAATATEEYSLLKDANVVAMPGTGSVGEPLQRWQSYFKDKTVILLFDNDHPKLNPVNNKYGEPNGLAATQRAVKLLQAAQMSYQSWGTEGYDPNLPTGYDVRDILYA